MNVRTLEANGVCFGIAILAIQANSIYGWIIAAACFIMFCCLVASYKLALGDKEVITEVNPIDEDLLKENKELNNKLTNLSAGLTKAEIVKQGITAENNRLREDLTNYITKNGSLQNRVEHLTEELDKMNEQINNLQGSSR